MEEEFYPEEETVNDWEEQSTLTQHPYRPAPENVQFYQPAPVFAPYPMYFQPDYRSFHPMHNHHAHPSKVPVPHPNHYHHPHHHEKKDPKEHERYMYDLCKRYEYHLIHCEGSDGQVYDGIIDSVDDEGVYLLVPVGDMERDDQADINRQLGFGYPGYGFGFPRRFRRFRRRRFPFFGLRRLFYPFFF